MTPLSSKSKGLLFLCLLSFFVHKEAIALDKKATGAISHFIMGVMHENLGNIDEAIKEYKKAASLDKEAAVIHLNLASSFIKKNEVPRAIQELKTTVKLDPEAIEPHAILALLYSSQNKIEQATSEYEIALKNASKEQPKNEDIYKSLGAIYLQQKKFKEALEAFKFILSLSPDNAQAHFYLGSIYNELNNNVLAEAEAKRALELKPDYDEALNFLGYLYLEENKNLDQAQALIKKAMEIEPNNAAYIDSLGWFYFKKHDFKSAIKELEKASILLEDPVIFDHLGDAYLKLDEPEKAKLNWQKSLKLDAKQDKVKAKLDKLSTK